MREAPATRRDSIGNGQRSARRENELALGLTLNYFGSNAVRMLLWSVVINGLLAPPLILDLTVSRF